MSEIPSQPLSKTAIKKAAKAERLASIKQERRAREREAKKEKRRIRAEKRAAGELDDEGDRRTKKRKLDFGSTVVIDLGFDKLMSDKEVISLCSQLSFTHGCNRLAAFPFSLVFTGISGRTCDRLEKTGDASHRRWQSTEWRSEPCESLWTESASRDKSTFVYLTADTDDELVELKPEESYIIGGIVDHNRYKNLCLNKAKELGIRTARLPIGKYLANLPTRKVLTVNQVFEILVKWVETKDWEEALYSVIPKRKFQQPKSAEVIKEEQVIDVEAEDEGEDDEDQDEGKKEEGDDGQNDGSEEPALEPPS